VLYNGIDSYPDQATLKLSDAFADKCASTRYVAPELDLRVKVFNINGDRNAGMLTKCETLHGYATFVSKVREEVAKIESLADAAPAGADKIDSTPGKREALNRAMPRAIDWCIRHGILSDFLNTNGSEVRNMLINDWNWEDALRVRDQDCIEKGRVEGRVEEREQVARNALAKGLPVTVISEITGLDTRTITQL
jgi:hypothetical protein